MGSKVGNVTRAELEVSWFPAFDDIDVQGKEWKKDVKLAFPFLDVYKKEILFPHLVGYLARKWEALNECEWERGRIAKVIVVIPII